MGEALPDPLSPFPGEIIAVCECRSDEPAAGEAPPDADCAEACRDRVDERNPDHPHGYDGGAEEYERIADSDSDALNDLLQRIYYIEHARDPQILRADLDDLCVIGEDGEYVVREAEDGDRHEYGEYDEGTSLTYFVTSGLVQSRTDSDAREEVTAWYNAEKERISAKESYLDMEINDWSTELEAINTEIQSIQSLIDDAISSVFDWGSS